LNPTRPDKDVNFEERKIDWDGLPAVGQKLEAKQVELCVFDTVAGKPKYMSFKDSESARVDSIRLMGDEKNPAS